MARVKPTRQKTNNGANVGYEAELWQMADALRGSMDAAVDKYAVLRLIFPVLPAKRLSAFIPVLRVRTGGSTNWKTNPARSPPCATHCCQS
jgi:hypothetical protein